MLAQSIKAYTRYDKKLSERIKSNTTLPALGVNQEWQGSSELELDGLFNFKTGSTRENEDISLRTTSQQMRYWNKKFYTRGLFLESPGNFSGPKLNIQIEIYRIRAPVLASKLLHFVSLTDSFIMLDAKLLEPRSLI